MAFKTRLRSYYWLTKPGIIYGNLITAAAGFLLAANGHIDINFFLFTLFGTALVIASACVFNNCLDKNIDKQMRRTDKRALVTGEISLTSAIVFAVVTGLVGILLLLALVNVLVALLGLIAELLYVLVYGYAKRHSMYGVLVGAIPGAAPPVMGYCAVTNQLNSGALILFLILFFWQLPHFYGIALYRLKEYQKAGIPVVPLQIGIAKTKLHALIYICAFVISTALLWSFGYASLAYLVIVGLAGLYWLWFGINHYRRLKSRIWGRKIFFISLIVNLVFAVSIAFNWLLVKI